MVTTRTIRGVGRRLLFALLATAGSAGVSVLPATAQTGTMSGMSMNDIPLAPGEILVNPGPSAGRTIQHNGGSYQIIEPSSVPMAAGPETEIPMASAPMMSSGHMTQYASGCATGRCGTSGSSGAFYGGNSCGVPCNPYLYAGLEGLFIQNTNVDNFSASPNFRLDDWDYEFGVRATVGIVPDCRNGMELSFVGPLDWSTEARTPVVPGGGIGTFLRPVAPLVAANLDTFNDAIFQAQRYDSEFFSVEANRTIIGWEICKFLYGLRYVNYDEDYFYRSVQNNGDQGLLRSSTENKMIGAQIGIDMTYPLTCKLWSDVRARGGAYANFAENTFEVNNAADIIVRNFDDDMELAGLFELGSGVRYYLTDDLHIRAGTELWYLTGVATSIDQFNSRIRPASGRRVNVDDDILMIGLSFGAELKF